MVYRRTIRFLPWILGLTLLVPSTKAQSSQSARIDSLWKTLQLARPDTNRAKLLAELGHLYVIKRGEKARDLDSALVLSRQAYTLSRSLNYLKGEGLSYLIAAQAYREKGNRQQGRQFAQQSINLLTRYGSPENQADMYIELATYYTVSYEDLTQQIRLYELAVPLLRQTENKLKLADALEYRGDLYQLQSHNEQAMNDLRQALALYRSIRHTQLEEIYDLLGFVSSKMGDYESGIKYGLLAMKTVEESGDSFKLPTVYSRLGITYHKLNQPDKALIFFNKSLRVAQTQYRRSTIIVLATTLNAVLDNYKGKAIRVLGVEEAMAHLQEVIKKRPIDNGDIDCLMAVATCYVNIYSKLYHDYARAQPFSNQLEAMLKTNLGQDYHLYIHGVLIPYYISSKQYGKAHILLVKNEILCQKAHYAKELSTNHLGWFKLDSAQGNYASAIAHYQRYNALNDSLITETTKQRTALFEVQYKTQEKEHKIIELRQQSKLQQSILQKAETTRNFIIVGAIMLGLLLALSYNRYWLKQRSNQLLEAKQLEINQKNQFLQRVLIEKDHFLAEKEILLVEKEWMLKEIHHRVKNNLQVVMSLLNSQASYLSDDAALSAIQESQHRVQAMALIHQKLYQSEQVARIEMPSYIQEVVAYLYDFYNLPQSIHFQLDVEPIRLDVTQAVPLGLIINEAITNALKYAFPRGRSGTITLLLHQLAKATYQLTITDNGVGLPPGYDPERSRSLGMTLMYGFSEQLGGELQISSPHGLMISLLFGEEQPNPTFTQATYA